MLLDDSYSMSENLGSLTAFDQAKNAIQRLGESVVRPREPQTFTLLRLSRCGGRYGGTRPDFQKETVDADFAQRLGDALESIEVSQTAAEPLPAFEAIQQLLGENAGERRIVYLFSDFRTRQWDKPDDLKKRLAQLDENHAEIRLIDCVEESGRPNLAITSLEPEEGIRAAGVQWRMQVTVQNYGPSAVRNVPVYWSADGKPGGTVTIDAIPPGRSAQKAFDVNFAVAGEHSIEAHLNADAVDADNHRYAVVDLPVDNPRAAGRRPAAPRRTRNAIADGVDRPQGHSAGNRLARLPVRAEAAAGRFRHDLRDQLSARSSARASRPWRNTSQAGGGVFFVTGPLTRGEYVTQDLYRNGKGLFPLPLTGPEPLVVDPLDNTPDVQSEEHYVFHNMDHRVENLSKIFVKQYFAVPAGWNAKSDPSVRVIMRLRNGAPLLVEKRLRPRPGAGLPFDHLGQMEQLVQCRVRSFVAFVLNMVPYLSHRFGASDALLVGEPKTLTFSAPPFEPAVHFSGPGGDASAATITRGRQGPHRGTRYSRSADRDLHEDGDGRFLQGPAHAALAQDGDPQFRRQRRSGGRRFAGPDRSRPGLPACPFEI